MGVLKCYHQASGPPAQTAMAPASSKCSRFRWWCALPACLEWVPPGRPPYAAANLLSLQDAAGVRMRGLLDQVEKLLSSDSDPQVSTALSQRLQRLQSV